jgi:hypothetical protein
MELVDRYVQAVRFLLPKRQRDDVGRELSEDLRSQIEEKEADLGRRLSDDETAALIKGFGHPLVLALRYQQGRYLIGPDVFPLFWFSVKSVLGILVVVHIVLPAIFFVVSGEPSQRVVGLFLRFPGVAVTVLGWMILGFAVLDTRVVRSAVEQSLAGWTPQSLPEVAKKDEAGPPPSAASLVLNALLSVWWLSGLAYPPLVLGPAAAYVDFAPVFRQLYIPMAAAAAVSLAVGWLRLSHPKSARVLAYAGLLADGLGLAVVYLLTRAPVFLVAREALLATPGHQSILDAVNIAVGVGLTLTLVAGGVALAWNGLKLARVSRGPR